MASETLYRYRPDPIFPYLKHSLLFYVFIVSVHLNKPNFPFVKYFQTFHTKKEPKLSNRSVNVADFVQGVVNDTPWRISVNLHLTYES